MGTPPPRNADADLHAGEQVYRTASLAIQRSSRPALLDVYTDTPLAPQVEIAEVYFAKGMWLVYRPVGMSSGPAINDFWRERRAFYRQCPRGRNPEDRRGATPRALPIEFVELN